jgi:hypothetical protein
VACVSDEHSEQILQAIRKQKHVFCDKPLALDASKVEQYLDEAQHHNVLLMCGRYPNHSLSILIHCYASTNLSLSLSLTLSHSLSCSVSLARIRTSIRSEFEQDPTSHQRRSDWECAVDALDFSLSNAATYCLVIVIVLIIIIVVDLCIVLSE